MSDDQISNGTVEDFDPFDNVTFDTQPDELPPYLGIIMEDDRSHGVYRDQVQHQWVYAVRPVDLKAKAFYGYVKFSTSRNSVFMRVKGEFARVLGKKNPDTGAPFQIGKKELIGKVLWFQQKSFEFGPGMSPSKPCPVPVRAATEEEIERALAMPAYVPAASGDDAGTPAQAPSLSFSADDTSILLDLYTDRDHKEVLKGVVKGDFEVSAELRSEIQSGRALNFLIEEGLADRDPQGIIRAKVVA